MRFVGRGHPAVRATHAKTLELTPGGELTERGTCIVAVGAEAQPAAPMAGPVRIRITAGGRSATLHATATSSWDPAGPIVVRRGPLRLPGTFATDADLAAADLPRDLVAALQDPDALVTVDVVAVPAETPTVVLFAADPSRPDDPRLRAELDAADTVEAQDAGARSLVEQRQADGPRRLVVATADLPRPPDDAAAVEVVGLPPQLAVIAAAGAGDYLVTTTGDVRRALRRTPAGGRVATVTTPTALPDLLALADEVRGSSRCTTAQPFGPIRCADVEHPPQLVGRDPVFVCFASADRPDGLDPDVRSAIAGLLADGVPSKTAAAALAALSGMPRRAAYDAVLALRDG
ncbi:DUF371 domain-containing protein [Jatrophihabitans endophyticus]|uniref:DUF371 domain-containing protein n=1 Tax=Jatrophihabitans endophyticus TaxID=1206085 RepID=UPI0019EFC7F1|nr:DUF371 domain-containing protein [Jatrophihabitans endophyticus]MBE7188104.1 DUF371 domain-containing protein [Jatrophihabitans endophyticus]